MKHKNIVLCADGTGNLGGTTPDTNVYRMFHLVDIHDPNHPQMTYYDNGVGTASNKYWRMFSGAFGFGFKRNVCELYEFLARHYVQGDQVFLFGFSRGAAEVRALSGMIASVGLYDGTGQSEQVLVENVKKAYTHYQRRNPELLFPNHGRIPITFIGVWDTVSALGFPKDWKVTGIGIWVINLLVYGLDALFDWFIFSHNFYNYELTNNVQHAYHALAIDDERLSFTPKIWDETIVNTDTTIEQVWFVGAHSNVGGGYGRAGLSYVVLEWMVSKALPLGLTLIPGALEEVKARKNAYGRMYDARDGVSLFYRYYPRKITELSRGKLRGRIKIHQSVFRRLKRFTEYYAPGYLPKEFEVVETGSLTEEHPLAEPVVIQDPRWTTLTQQLNTWTSRRSWLYGAFLEYSLLIVIMALCLWVWPELFRMFSKAPWTGWGSSILTHIADILNYFSPMMFENFIQLTVLQRPVIFLALLGILILLFFLRSWTRKHYRDVCEELRLLLLKSFPS